MSRLLIVVSLLLQSSVVGATHVDPMPIDRLEARAELIATGTITEVHSQWEHGRIYSYAHFATEEALLGQPTTEAIAIRIPGGEVGDIGMVAFGTPDLRVGQRLLLFVRRNPHSPSWHIVGYNQGALNLRVTEDTVLVEPCGTTRGSIPTTQAWPVTLSDYRAVLRELRGSTP